MTNMEFLKLLKEKKVANSFQYYDACIYKLYLAEISRDALDKIIDEFETDGANAVKQVFQDTLETGQGSYKPMRQMVDFCGVEIPLSTATTKLTMEVLSLLHNFFDVFAQWINASLFGEEALTIAQVSLPRVIRKLSNYPEYNGQFIADVVDIPNKDIYKYISDFNNTMKHRSQIHVGNSINMFTAEGSVSIPDFSKDGSFHSKKEVIDAVHDGYNFCSQLLTESANYIENYYLANDCKYVEHRLYNPEQFLMFESEEDCEQMRNVKNHYAYIEVDPSNISNEYDIMLVHDTTDQEGGCIQLYNSPYPIIMLREKETSNIIGIIKPEDAETYRSTDDHDLCYRRYISQTTGYELEMFKAVCEDSFKFYPMLGDSNIFICKDETVESTEPSSESSNHLES